MQDYRDLAEIEDPYDQALFLDALDDYETWGIVTPDQVAVKHCISRDKAAGIVNKILEGGNY